MSMARWTRFKITCENLEFARNYSGQLNTFSLKKSMWLLQWDVKKPSHYCFVYMLPANRRTFAKFHHSYLRLPWWCLFKRQLIQYPGYDGCLRLRCGCRNCDFELVVHVNGTDFSTPGCVLTLAFSSTECILSNVNVFCPAAQNVFRALQLFCAINKIKVLVGSIQLEALCLLLDFAEPGDWAFFYFSFIQHCHMLCSSFFFSCFWDLRRLHERILFTGLRISRLVCDLTDSIWPNNGPEAAMEESAMDTVAHLMQQDLNFATLMKRFHDMALKRREEVHFAFFRSLSLSCSNPIYSFTCFILVISIWR